MSTPAPATPITQKQDAQASALEQLVARRVELKADAEYIAEQIEQIDAQLIDLLGTVGTHDVAGTKVQIREYSRTDLKKLAADYPADQYPALYATSLDSAAVKKQFAPAALEQYVVHGKKSVVIP